MQKALLARRGKRPVALIPDCALGLIDTDDRNANRIPSAMPELNDLVPKIIDHTVDLLDHRLCEDLHLDADFYGCYRSSCHEVTGISDRRLAWDDFPERSIAPPSRDTVNSLLFSNVRFSILIGSITMDWRQNGR